MELPAETALSSPKAHYNFSRYSQMFWICFLDVNGRWQQAWIENFFYLSSRYTVLIFPSKEDNFCTSGTGSLCLNEISNLLTKLRSRNSANGDMKSSYVMVISHPQWKEPALDWSSPFADQKSNTGLANKDSPHLAGMFLCQLSELRGNGGNVDSISSLHSLQSPLVKEATIQSAKSLVLKMKQW